MTDSIDGNLMQQAAEHVIHANRAGDVHTVTLELNGQHGGVDLVIKGSKRPTPGWFGEDIEWFEKKFEVR